MNSCTSKVIFSVDFQHRRVPVLWLDFRLYFSRFLPTWKLILSWLKLLSILTLLTQLECQKTFCTSRRIWLNYYLICTYQLRNWWTHENRLLIYCRHKHSGIMYCKSLNTFLWSSLDTAVCNHGFIVQNSSLVSLICNVTVLLLLCLLIAGNCGLS